jgi:hypothetical protein
MWAQILNTIMGIWLMAAPHVLTYSGVAADNDHIVGPIVASFAVIALSGCTRSTANFNAPLGVWLLLAPWILGYETPNAILSDSVSGLVITFLSTIKRSITQSYGGGWSTLWKSAAEPNPGKSE